MSPSFQSSNAELFLAMNLAENAHFRSCTAALNTMHALPLILTADRGVPLKWTARANTSVANGAIVNLTVSISNKVR